MQSLLILRFFMVTRGRLANGFTWYEAAWDAQRRGQPEQTVKALRWLADGKLNILD